MNTQEVIKKANKGRTGAIAKKVGLSQETLYKWGQGNLINPVERVADLQAATNSDDIVNYLCAERDGVFYKFLNVEECKDYSIIPKMAIEFGEFMKEIGEAHQDGKVTREEFQRIKEKTSNLLGVILGFIDRTEKELS